MSLRCLSATAKAQFSFDARRVLALVIALGLAAAAVPAPAAQSGKPAGPKPAADKADAAKAEPVKYDEIGGSLPDGTVYLIRVPKNWTGTVISDLDYAANPNTGFRMYWLGRGYATSGTRRHALRQFLYDPAQEAYNQLRVLDILEAKFGKPKRVIQYGQSGGGLIAAGVAELYPNRIDGSVSACFQMPVALHSMRLDAFFALRTLLPGASDLPVVNMPEDLKDVIAKWTEAVTAAHQTPEGRARIALAVTIGQFPAWTLEDMPEPDSADPGAIEAAMFQSLIKQVIRQNLTTRQRNENAGGGVFVGNTGVDYEEFFNNGYEPYKRAVWNLYRDAKLDLKADLDRINKAPRIEADGKVVKDFWHVSPRTLSADPKIPILQIATLGDEQAPGGLMRGYEDQVRARGKAHLYRQVVVHGPGHCDFTDSERVTAVETMMVRLDTGQWPSTHPRTLNHLARSLKLDEPRFMLHNWPKLNRAIFVDVTDEKADSSAKDR